MAKVKFYELSSSKELQRFQSMVNRELKSKGIDASVRLFADQAGKIGYSVSRVPVDGGKKHLDAVHRIVRQILGLKRGRPAKEPTRQVKCRIPESVYERLEAEAKQRHIRTSKLIGELASKHVA